MFVRLNIYNNKFLFDDSNDKMLNAIQEENIIWLLRQKK